MSMNRLIHCAVRRDLDRFVDALSRFPAGEESRAAELGEAWRHFHGELTRHHTDEHAIAWPALEQVGVDPALLAKFDAEHDAMAAALAEADTAMSRLESSPTGQAAAEAVRAMTKLRTVTAEHLDHEEAELEPVYFEKRDTPEIREMGRKFGKVSPKVGGAFFAWVQDGASADERAALRVSVPGPVLTIIGGLFGRSYRKTAARAWHTGR
jgi:hypothetical protein